MRLPNIRVGVAVDKDVTWKAADVLWPIFIKWWEFLRPVLDWAWSSRLDGENSNGTGHMCFFQVFRNTAGNHSHAIKLIILAIGLAIDPLKVGQLFVEIRVEEEMTYEL